MQYVERLEDKKINRRICSFSASYVGSDSEASLSLANHE